MQSGYASSMWMREVGALKSMRAVGAQKEPFRILLLRHTIQTGRPEPRSGQRNRSPRPRNLQVLGRKEKRRWRASLL